MTAVLGGGPEPPRAGAEDAPLEHYVNPTPWNPYVAEALTPKQEAYYLASQWRIMWWKLRRHRLAVVSGAILAVLYASILISEFLAPYSVDARNSGYIYAPPQAVHLFHDGRLVGPYVYGYSFELNLETMRREYTIDTDKVERLRFFCAGPEYEFWGMWPARAHLFCPAEGGTAFLLGTDRLGRDMLSRIVHGARISLTIGLVGVSVSFLLAIIIGGAAGYYGGWVDNVVNRIIEIFQSFPQLPLWMALAAALPVTWSPLLVYFGITIILGLVDWTGLARAIRSKLLALREEDFATAAALMGASPRRIVGRHLLPSFMSHLIASVTLTIPEMILAETALSFLGIGLRPPITSWGVLLSEAQNMNAVALYPWIMAPAIPVIVVVLCFQFLGDGLRDAADPYK